MKLLLWLDPLEPEIVIMTLLNFIFVITYLSLLTLMEEVRDSYCLTDRSSNNWKVRLTPLKCPCWLDMPLGAGILIWVLACLTIEKN